MEHKEYIKEVPNSKTVVLFIHGILGTPRYFNNFLESVPKNISIHNILLDGHGCGVDEFSNTSMDKWKKCVDEKIKELYKKYENIIIVAHSMGTFFAMEASLKYPQKVKALFLLAVPLKIIVKPDASINAMKVIFNKIDNNPVTESAKIAYGVKADKKIWKYAMWLPRYLELFKESKSSRELVDRITAKTYVFLSLKDELVSVKSYKYFTKNPNIKLTVLKNSRHYYYEDKEKKLLNIRLNELCSEFE